MYIASIVHICQSQSSSLSHPLSPCPIPTWYPCIFSLHLCLFLLCRNANQSNNGVSSHIGQMAIIKKTKSTDSRCCRGYEEKASFTHCWWECKLIQPLRRTVRKFVGGGGGLLTESCLTLVTLWTVAHQAPLSMGFPRQEYWRGLLFPSPMAVP